MIGNSRYFLPSPALPTILPLLFHNLSINYHYMFLYNAVSYSLHLVFVWLQLASGNNLDAVLQQQILDQFRKDNEMLQSNLEKNKNKSLDETKVGGIQYLYLFVDMVVGGKNRILPRSTLKSALGERLKNIRDKYALRPLQSLSLGQTR